VPKPNRTGHFDMVNSAFHSLDGTNCAAAEASLEFGRFRVLLRQRRLLADGAPIELGTRAFELLLVLLEADGSLVSKKQLLARVWPGIAVVEDNLKAQVFALRRALGDDRGLIRTEFGRGYRFTAAVRSNVAGFGSQRSMRLRYWSTRTLSSQQTAWRRTHGWSVRHRFGRHFDPVRSKDVTSCQH